MSYIVGVDIGGTFTDASAVRQDDSRVFTAKAPSTPDDLTRGLLEALEFLAEDAGETLESLLARTTKFAHGTTQTSNIMLTWVGATTGLITTSGFADEILIMRARGRVAGVSLANRRHLRATDKPPQIVPRHLIVEVAERVDYRGRVVLPLHESDVTLAVDHLVELGVESIAVSLLWSPMNPTHELRIAEIIAERAPHVYVSLSHKLAPVVGEYERTSTAVVNAFVGPTVERYLCRLDDTLRTKGLRTPLLVLQAGGGVTDTPEAVPIRTIESGPAAGIVAAKALADVIGEENVLATDVGGTTFKVGLLIDGEWSVSRETIINQYSLLMPAIDLASIGAGGGSIAWVDDTRLRVGPLSAGSDPGPACYRWGGTRPTVTDADLALGFLNPDRFLGGRLKVDRDSAEAALKEHVADHLFDGDVIVSATAIRKIIDAQMTDLLHKQTIQRGHDPRLFTLMAYGGAGPVHAAAFARGLGVDRIIVPQAAAAYSAYGAAVSNLRTSLQRSVRADLLDDDVDFVSAFHQLERSAIERLKKQTVAPYHVDITRWVDMRYTRQLHDLRVAVRALNDETPATKVRDTFEELYGRLYGRNAVMRSAEVQLLRIGIDLNGRILQPDLQKRPLGPPDPSLARREPRSIFWPEVDDWVRTDIYDGEALRPGHVVEGPAVIEQTGTTIVIPPTAHIVIDNYANVVMTLE